MEKEFVPYELAVKLKALGFDEPCFGCYQEIEKRDYKPILEVTKSIGLNTLNGVRNYNQEDRVSAPTFSQAFRWFREKYGDYLRYSFGVVPHFNIILNLIIEDSTITYEEAELACLIKLIEIVEKTT